MAVMDSTLARARIPIDGAILIAVAATDAIASRLRRNIAGRGGERAVSR